MSTSLGLDRKQRENAAARSVTLRKPSVAAPYRRALAERIARLRAIKPPRKRFGRVHFHMYARRTIHHRNLWSVESLSRADMLDVLDTARRLRQARLNGESASALSGRNVALLSDTSPADGAGSLRQAAIDLGAQVSHVRPSDARIAPGSADEATARLLGRLYDAIDCEEMPSQLVADVARGAGVPVFNGLGGSRHPTRVLAELLAMQDHCGKSLDAMSVCFVGDPRTPCGDALLRAAAATGIELRIASPRDRWPPPELWERLKAAAVAHGTRLHLYETAAQAGTGSDILVHGQDDPPWPIDGLDRTDRHEYRRFMLQALLTATIG